MRCHLDIENGTDINRPGMAVCASCHEHSEQLGANRCEPCHVNVGEENKRA